MSSSSSSSASSTPLSIIKATQDYVSKMIQNIPGMKVLLLDKETMGIVSMVHSQSEILQKEVYLFDRLDNATRDTMTHVNAVAFLRPTEENFQLLGKELRSPKYGEYHLFFSNVIKGNFLEELAQCDEHELVKQVQEFFGDVFAVTPHTFSLNLPTIFFSAKQTGWAVHKRRVVDGVMAMLLALRRRPIIRHVISSDLAEQVAADVARRIDENSNPQGLFDFRQSSAPLLIVLDRKDDPVTPLLQQWTYQAMVHELIGIENNRVDLSSVKDIKKDFKQIVLSAEQDHFYAANMFVNFGDLGENIKSFVEKYQTKTKSNENIQSLDDIKRFIEDFPEIRKLAVDVSKHVALVGELSRRIDERQLMPVSELEQEIACKSDHGTAKANVLEFIAKPNLALREKLRLAMLYVLKYESTTSVATDKVLEALAAAGADRDELRQISTMIEYAGANRRSGDLFGTKNLLSLATKSFRRGLSGTSNVYTEHVPALAELLDNAIKGKLKDAVHPLSYGSAPAKDKLQEIFVYIVGGITYEEVVAVDRFMATNAGVRVILGGCCVHNSSSFLNGVMNARNA